MRHFISGIFAILIVVLLIHWVCNDSEEKEVFADSAHHSSANKQPSALTCYDPSGLTASDIVSMTATYSKINRSKNTASNVAPLTDAEYQARKKSMNEHFGQILNAKLDRAYDLNSDGELSDTEKQQRTRLIVDCIENAKRDNHKTYDADQNGILSESEIAEQNKDLGPAIVGILEDYLLKFDSDNDLLLDEQQTEQYAEYVFQTLHNGAAARDLARALQRAHHQRIAKDANL